ncbi:D-aminoacyl-tRNA deacylase [hydrothermal vent metagenome]|uniref:D-aminoacyl-tRNA deacylase n=1 Tax=hydrothermal vent metagenome TaxID=652676 RepID=A0A3B0RCE5_9ZZZZ
MQRVKEASVSVDGELLSSIGTGLLALVGAKEGDSVADADYIASKISGLRIFPDAEGKMNLTCTEAGGATTCGGAESINKVRYCT